ncbi:hypothetical protein BGZ65_000450 [Modicella reniformis]|uniref:SET domain-containing protein n=1 Tax=Modicella reniformis TaxID=1440133 RepID=A0A9P6J2Y8_9FUNG|nr:hypothetical protein BGZ65_000450 [Modicella reniformis]
MASSHIKQNIIIDAEIVKRSYNPSHPGLFEVVYAEGTFNSQLLSSKDFQKGDVICTIEGTTPGPKMYTTVQISKELHIELNSDLSYLNHSCNPSTLFNTEKMQLIAAVDIKKGDPLTFFYPSSEWEMDQPFSCWCGAEHCCKSIQGAKFVPMKIMDRYYVTPHISELLLLREAEAEQ